MMKSKGSVHSLRTVIIYNMHIICSIWNMEYPANLESCLRMLYILIYHLYVKSNIRTQNGLGTNLFTNAAFREFRMVL